MTNEEIKKAITDLKTVHQAYDVMCGDWSFCWTAIEALEKQLPKPPKQDYDEAKNLTYYKCPTCGEDVITFIPENRMTIKEHHCRCGQALLWEKE